MEAELLLTCNRGLESICAEEVLSFGLKIVDEKKGKIICKGNEKDAIILNYGARTINRVIFLFYKGKFSDLHDIEKIARDQEWERFISREKTFGVEAKRIGRHGFTSMDVAKKVGQGVIERIEAKKGFRAKVFLRDPDVKVYAEVNRDELFLGIDLSGESLHMRGYRVYQHPAPLSPSLAASLLFIAEKPETLLDPFCGSGTIPIENILMHWNVPKIWRSFAFEKIEEFVEIFEEVREKWKIKRKEVYGFGFDKYEKHVRGAIRNAESAGVKDAVEFWVGDATLEDSFRDAEAIVTNPPYGIRIASKRMIERLYDAFCKNLADIGYEKVVVITGEPYFIKAAERADMKLKEKWSIIYGSLPSLVLLYEI